MIAVGYIRVSSEEQTKHGVSLDAQADKIGKYAAFKGLTLRTISHDESVSGSIPLGERAGGKTLLAMLESGAVTNVIITKQDRLFRDTIDCLSTLRDWEEKIVLHIIDEGGVVDTSTPNGWMQVAMRAMFADYEVKTIRHRTRAAFEHKKAAGQVYNHVPYGYMAEAGMLVEDSAEQAVIESIRIMRSAKNPMTLQGIADVLNGNKVPTKKGGDWHPQTVSNALNFSLNGEQADDTKETGRGKRRSR